MPVHLRCAWSHQTNFLRSLHGSPVRFGAGSIIDNAAIGRPDEAPAVAEIIFRLARVRFVYFVWTENAGINPTAACGRTVGFQFGKTVDLRTVMRIAFAIDAEDDALCISVCGVSVPAIDLGRARIPFSARRVRPPDTTSRARAMVHRADRSIAFAFAIKRKAS